MARDGDGIYGPYVRQHLYGGHKEETYGFFPRQPTCLAKIKDDIFLIWTHGRAKLEAFIQHANTFHPTIKFTSNISTIHVPFLEVMVTLLGNYIHTYFYSKPTDTFNYLHWSSCHPQHTKLSIPYSLAFRLVRVCSSEATLTRRLNNLKHHLKKRGFSHKYIQTAINKALEAPRSKTPQRKDRSLTESQRIPLGLTCNTALPNIPSVVKNISPFSKLQIEAKKPSRPSPWQLYTDPKTYVTH